MPTKLYTIHAAIQGTDMSGDHEYIQTCIREHVQMHLHTQGSGKAAMAWELVRAMDKLWYMGTGEEAEIPVTQDKRNNIAVDQYQTMLETWFTTTVVGDSNPIIAGFCNGYGMARAAWGAIASRAQITALKDLQRVLIVAQQRGLPADEAAMVITLHEWAGVTLPDWAAEVIAAW